MNDPLATTAVGYCVDADDPAIAVITMRHAPVNSLGHALRDGVARALARAQADPRVRAVVLTGNGRAFSAGADVTEFGTPLQRAAPARATNTSPKPLPPSARVSRSWACCWRATPMAAWRAPTTLPR